MSRFIWIDIMDKTYNDPCYGHGGPNCCSYPCPVCGRQAPDTFPQQHNSLPEIPKGMGFNAALHFMAEEINKKIKKELDNNDII